MHKNLKGLEPKMEGEPDVKKLKTSIISQHVESTEFQELVIKHWHSMEPVKTDTVRVITKPYRICKISNFLSDDTFISRITDELKDVKSQKNNMDLYQFEQTEDLANVQSESIAHLYRTFKYDVMAWMAKVTIISLSGKISMSSSNYTDTDYLLCHDDNVGDRRIAFVLYLSKDWTRKDGGTLDIFDTDENGQPNKIVRSLIPEYNSLVFFEVVDNSYHQVAEITSPDKRRISINGWFHGSLRISSKQHRIERIYEYFEPEYTEVDLVSYVSKIYLREKIVTNIQKTFEEDSFIYLPGFLLPEKYEALSVDLKSKNIKWEKIGPADLQNYEIANENTLPQALKEFYNIFKSIHVFHLLKQYTELDLVPEIGKETPKVKIELQRWSRGSYMLINKKESTDYFAGLSNKTKYMEIDNPNVHVLTQADTEKYEKKRRESRNEKNYDSSESSKIKQPIATGSGGTIPLELEKELLKSPQKESNTKADNTSTNGKEKVSMYKNTSTDSTNLQNEESSVTVSGDVDSSDIEEYLSSRHSDSESNISELDRDEDIKPGTLDVILQFHTNTINDDTTIDYIDPNKEDGALIHVPPQDNHLCLVYRTADTCRCNKYVNHYCKDYFYTLVCSYDE